MSSSGSTWRLAAASLAFVLHLSHHVPARAEPDEDPGPAASPAVQKPETKARPSRLSANDICRTLAQAAADNDLPIDFFTRLIWQESRFNPAAVSPKGAMGIAQFMPGTASGRGLADPFEPLLALRESASYLQELRTTFQGNLGLAAAAYNAGPGRVEAWLAGRRGLPAETQAYVRAVTGHSADAWASKQPPQWQASNIPKGAPCVELAKSYAVAPRPPPVSAPSPAWGPWGVQLAGNWSEGQLLASYERLRRKHEAVLRDRLPLVLRAGLSGKGRAAKYLVRVSESSRVSADALCAKLRATGGACIVLRNPPG
jgi:Transglycosylase SLT domain